MATSSRRSRPARSSRRAPSARRAARAHQVQRDLLRFERAFDDWAVTLEIDLPPALRDVADHLTVGLILMPGSPRSVTGWTLDETFALTDALLAQDETGRTSAAVGAHLHLWTQFLLETGRWSGSSQELAGIRAVLEAEFEDPAEPPLDPQQAARLRQVVSQVPAQDAELTALDATRPVRQCHQLIGWLGSGTVPAGTFLPEPEAIRAAIELLGGEDAGVDELRVLQLWSALRVAGLVVADEGVARITKTRELWDGDDLDRRSELRCDVVTTVWSWSMHFDRDQDVDVRVVALAVLDLVEGQRVTNAELGDLVHEHDRDPDGFIEDDIRSRFDALAADGAVQRHGEAYSVTEALRPLVAAMMDEALRSWNSPDDV